MIIESCSIDLVSIANALEPRDADTPVTLHPHLAGDISRYLRLCHDAQQLTEQARRRSSFAMIMAGVAFTLAATSMILIFSRL